MEFDYNRIILNSTIVLNNLIENDKLLKKLFL